MFRRSSLAAGGRAGVTIAEAQRSIFSAELPQLLDKIRLRSGNIHGMRINRHPLTLFRYRHDPVLSQRDLAQELGVTHAAISRWESGVRTIALDLVPFIVEKTGISAQELRPDLVKLLTPEAEPWRRQFNTQRRQAKHRKIAWELTFEQWLKIWQDSGNLIGRGRKTGQYVMARNGDVGPYAVDNVKIIRAADNIREAHSKDP